jgi:hypothetical protein
MIRNPNISQAMDIVLDRNKIFSDGRSTTIKETAQKAKRFK